MRDSEQVNRLVEDNLKLVHFIVRRYYPDFATDEDIIQVGSIGLIKAAKTWDEERTKFSTYASICIKNEVGTYLRDHVFNEPVLYSLDFELSEMPEFSDSNLTLGDTIEDLNAELAFENIYDDAFLFTLKEKERIMVQYRRLGYFQSEIAEALGVNQSHVSRTLRSIKRKWERIK